LAGRAGPAARSVDVTRGRAGVVCTGCVTVVGVVGWRPWQRAALEAAQCFWPADGPVGRRDGLVSGGRLRWGVDASAGEGAAM
jgi:hypothetical protein